MKQINTFKVLSLMVLSLMVMAMACSSDSVEPTPEPEPPFGSGDIPPVGLAIECDAEGSEWDVSQKDSTLPMRIVADSPAWVDMVIDLKLEDGTVDGVAPIPAEAVALPESLSFPKNGEQVDFEVTVDGSKLAVNTPYRLAISISEKGGNAGFGPEEGMVELTIIRKSAPRTMRQILYFEVNNCNPLNALEYRLEDGSPFFDAVVLFAANINYNQEEDRVYLHCNPNVQALLDNSEQLLQPLRRAGIKVYLGLLGNHDVAGLAQLSTWGAQTWAQEVAETCKRYGLDGVNLDDEYSKSPDLSNKWFTLASASAGARLAYELKKALREQCSWPTEVSIFEYGKLQNLPAVLADGGSHPQSEFIDILVPNYGSASVPYGDLTYGHCAGAAIELNYKQPLAEGYARSILKQGFGWCMWFGFDPSGSGGVKSNLEYSFAQFQTAAHIFYDQELVAPSALYHKLGEGSYDAEPHPIQN